MHEFEYFAPKDLKEALNLLSSGRGKYAVIAGGTDLLPAVRAGEAKPEALVDISRLKGLDHLRSGPEGLEIGPLVTHTKIALAPELNGPFKLLAEASLSIGGAQVRNRGTIGGNIAFGSPAGDTIPALLALDAVLTLQSKKGKREVKIVDFFTGPGQTVMKSDEIIVNIEIGRASKAAASSFIKFGRRNAMAISVVSAGAYVELSDGHFKELRVALGSVAPMVVRASSCEEALRGKEADPRLIEEASKKVVDDISPISDIRASAEYRGLLAQVLLKRSINQAVAALARA